jgi:hypothetical protein
MHQSASKARWVLNILTEMNAGPFAKGKGSERAPAPGAIVAIHVRVFETYCASSTL